MAEISQGGLVPELELQRYAERKVNQKNLVILLMNDAWKHSSSRALNHKLPPDEPNASQLVNFNEFRESFPLDLNFRIELCKLL